MPIKIFTALLVQDVQNDFMKDGALPVAGAEAVLEPISKMAATFDRVIATQEFRPDNHVVFADSHAGMKPGESIDCDGQKIILTPKFCVEGSVGADFARGLRLPMSRVIAILKGTNAQIDTYSAFLEADRKTQTGLQSDSSEVTNISRYRMHQVWISCSARDTTRPAHSPLHSPTGNISK